MPTRREPAENPLTTLSVRQKPTPETIAALIEGMKTALRSAGPAGHNFYARMEQNHDARMAWWVGQTTDGRKWSRDPNTRRNCILPGDLRDEVFPYEGASDARVRLVDTVIRERVDFMRLALQRRQERIGPRNLGPDEDAQTKSAMWSQVFSLCEERTRRQFRRQSGRWASIAQEYGHGLLFTGWQSDAEVIPMRMSIEEVMAVMAQSAVKAAEATLPEGQTFTQEQIALITQDAAIRVEDMRADPEQRALFVAAIQSVDPSMPTSEAERLATDMRFGEVADYYTIDPKDEQPEWRALTPFIDVFYPATTETIQKAPWVCMTEWVTQAELTSRIDTEGYDKDWVAAVIAQKGGRSFSLDELGLNKTSWLLSSGNVRCGLNPHSEVDTNADAYQILHVYYRATALGNARALYRTVIHGAITDKYATHECCPYAHGSYPFFETLSETDAPYLIASRGCGELTDTLQDTAKTTVDEIRDTASMRARPPMLVPQTQTGAVPWYPGARIKTRNISSGMGLFTPIETKMDSAASVSMHTLNMDLFNEFWARGPKVDPEVKLAARQTMVSDFLEDVREARVMTFQLIQEFAPDELKAAFVDGLAVNLSATRADIQGMISMELDFDVQDLDSSKTKEFMESLQIVSLMDDRKLINKEPMLKAMTSRMLPAYRKTLVADPSKRATEERTDEKRIITDILAGTQTPEDEQASYYPGDHASRMKFIADMFGVQTDAKGNVIQMLPLGEQGQPTRAQRLFQEDQDVQARVLTRLQFHARQLQQDQNAITGSRQVSTVTTQAPAFA